jgi:hypothetical protein
MQPIVKLIEEIPLIMAFGALIALTLIVTVIFSVARFLEKRLR